MSETVKTPPVRRLVRRRAVDAKQAGVASAPPQEERAEPAREAQTPPDRLTRRSRFDMSADPLNVPKHLRKPGWDYQWMVTRVVGQPVDPSELLAYHQQGWRPARSVDYPTMLPDGVKSDHIERLGQILMVRPMSLTMQARQEDMQAAEEARRDKLQGAAQGRASDGALNNVRGVVPHTLSVEIEGEAGTYANSR
jgi:hypothetical protein